MRLTMLKSKVHRITVTEADLHYDGSFTLDEELMELAHLVPHERIELYDVTNGNRIATTEHPSCYAPTDRAPPNVSRFCCAANMTHRVRNARATRSPASVTIACYVVPPRPTIEDKKQFGFRPLCPDQSGQTKGVVWIQ